jgi:aryl-alcohol dehydrogenase-like predicted oxidoreductase
LGTFNFGGHTDAADAHRILDGAIDIGINFIDTANTYPGPIAGHLEGKGRSEVIVGDWLDADRSRRDRVVLATKVFGQMGPGPNDRGLSAKNIRHALDESLRRLRTDHIDLYQFHHVDRSTPWDEIWQAIEVAITQGKILYVGSSNFAGWHLAQAQESAQRHAILGLVSEQALYNLLVRDIERELLPAAQAYGLGVLAWSPLHAGLLAGAARDGARRREGRAAETLRHRREDIAEFERLSASLDLPPWRLALGWVLSRPGVAAALIGPRTVGHLVELAELDPTEMTDEVLDALDALFPGPKTAPEDHAW